MLLVHVITAVTQFVYLIVLQSCKGSNPSTINMESIFDCRLGYEGQFYKRQSEYFDEGEATFYRTSRFSFVKNNSYSLAELATEVRNL